MLSLLPKCAENVSFEQRLINDKEKVSRLCRNNIIKKSVARSFNNCYELILYKRFNYSGMGEAGIIYIYTPGPVFEEMLRLFSEDKDFCFDLACKYYTDLVAEQNLHYIKK